MFKIAFQMIFIFFKNRRPINSRMKPKISNGEAFLVRKNKDHQLKICV